jgi:hypothetical protein
LKNGELVRIRGSGWFLVRAIADLDHTFRFACTGPWYLDEIADMDPPPTTKESARFFLDWTRERMTRLEQMEFAGKDEALEPIRRAEAFWKAKAERGD